MIKNTHKKYNDQGGINGIWLAIEEANYQEQHELEMHRKHNEIDREFGKCNYYNNDCIIKNNYIENDQKEMCKFNHKKELEDNYNFLKQHSGSPEDLEIAKEVLRLKYMPL